MINYDLPWNPVRLEQRMGRVHRIGQTTDCWIFNFCAVNTVEGQLLERLMVKLGDMSTALGGRVYDVLGDLLAINGVDFERLVPRQVVVGVLLASTGLVFDLTAESLHNLGYPIDWDRLLDYVGRPAILKPYSGGGWKHVYKVHDRDELIHAYDGTGPYCMTLQQFINFDQYVRCFTFGKTDIVPVAYDPHQRRYLVEHEYLSAELGARIVRDAQTLNLALGYEMNTIEFAVQDGVPYAIDFLNPAPDFERERITPFYFDLVVERMADLVIDRALNGQPQQTWPRWAQMTGLAEASPV